jgi:hypothetical protein
MLEGSLIQNLIPLKVKELPPEKSREGDLTRRVTNSALA